MSFLFSIEQIPSSKRAVRERVTPMTAIHPELRARRYLANALRAVLLAAPLVFAPLAQAAADKPAAAVSAPAATATAANAAPAASGAASIEPGVATSSSAAPAAPIAGTADAAAATAPAPAAADATAPAAAGDAAATPAPVDTRGLDEQIQGLKKDAVDLNRELFMLEEELLFPANTQVAVFLSMDVGEFFALDSVQLKMDGREVTNYLYTPKEADALLKGGVHRLYLGNLKVGEHELVALFNGKGPNERDYRRGATLSFKKAVGAKYLELKITDKQRKGQPEFEIKDWE